jgi:3-deoxy-D-manno-octulosonic-acid transferase
MVVNGRVGDKTFRRLRRFPRVSGWLFSAVDRFAVQTGEDARRLQALGVEGSRVTVVGNLKYEAAEPPVSESLETRLLALAAGRPLLVAGSTMAGEEAAVLAAYAATGGSARALLVLAPRHPERWEEVAHLLDTSGVAWRRRSALDRPVDVTASEDEEADDTLSRRQVAVVLLDSLGELAGLYRLAAAAFVGGTLTPTGGHNPLEPARFGRATAVGPSMFNFRDMAAQFDRAGAWRRIADAAELGHTWRGWLDDAEAAREVGDRARRLVEDNRGALARTVAALAPLLERASTESARAAGEPALPVAASR